MNFSWLLLVLFAFVGFLIYDMFKKNRQEQQIQQVQQVQSRAIPNKLTPNYAAECNLLKQLHLLKQSTIKHKAVSIHLAESIDPEASVEDLKRVGSIVNALTPFYKIYLLVCRKAELRNPMVEVVRQAGASEIGFDSLEGAVAVLRQLNCGTHLEGELSLYKAIAQYLPNVWTIKHPQVQTINHCKSQSQMLKMLVDLIPNKEILLRE